MRLRLASSSRALSNEIEMARRSGPSLRRACMCSKTASSSSAVARSPQMHASWNRSSTRSPNRRRKVRLIGQGCLAGRRAGLDVAGRAGQAARRRRPAGSGAASTSQAHLGRTIGRDGQSPDGLYVNRSVLPRMTNARGRHHAADAAQMVTRACAPWWTRFGHVLPRASAAWTEGDLSRSSDG